VNHDQIRLWFFWAPLFGFFSTLAVYFFAKYGAEYLMFILARICSKKGKKMNFNMFDLPSVGPYLGVSFDGRVTFETESGARTFRVIVYAAFNAHGLIGPECNGIAVLDENKRMVVMDEGNKIVSGYYGPGRHQLCAAQHMVTDFPWESFRGYVNSHPRNRYQI
jgi:hypothetical protein